MDQAKKAGFNKFILIASNATLRPLQEKFNDNFKGIPIFYEIQETPSHRKKPFGTAHALMSTKNSVDGPFIVLNSDDIYGYETLTKIYGYLKKDLCCIPGYKLKNCVPEIGSVNRGFISVKGDILEKIEEKFNITKGDMVKMYNPEQLVSMNLFGLKKEFFSHLEKEFGTFLEKHKDDPVKEFLLPDAVTSFIQHNKIPMHVIVTNDTPLGLTNPEDEEKLKQILKNKV
jgi:hypothetical protein